MAAFAVVAYRVLTLFSQKNFYGMSEFNDDPDFSTDYKFLNGKLCVFILCHCIEEKTSNFEHNNPESVMHIQSLLHLKAIKSCIIHLQKHPSFEPPFDSEK